MTLVNLKGLEYLIDFEEEGEVEKKNIMGGCLFLPFSLLLAGQRLISLLNTCQIQESYSQDVDMFSGQPGGLCILFLPFLLLLLLFYMPECCTIHFLPFKQALPRTESNHIAKARRKKER